MMTYPVTLHASSESLVPALPLSTFMQLSSGNAIARHSSQEEMQPIQTCVDQCLKKHLGVSYDDLQSRTNLQSRTIGWYEEGSQVSYPIQVICRYLLSKENFPPLVRVLSCPSVFSSCLPSQIKLPFKRLPAAAFLQKAPQQVSAARMNARMNWKDTLGKIRALVRLPRVSQNSEAAKTFIVPKNAAGGPPVIHIHESRWLEKLDSARRYGGDLHKQWEIWEKQKNLTGMQHKHFFSWLKSQEVQISRVRYLSDDERIDYELRIENGKFSTKKEGILHTQDVGNPHIYVVVPYPSKERGVYHQVCLVGPYERGYFHHTSLSGGAPVLMAGELIFKKNGELHQITDKSGHYRTKETATAAFLAYLKCKNITYLQHVIVTVDCVREPFDSMRDGRGAVPPPRSRANSPQPLELTDSRANSPQPLELTDSRANSPQPLELTDSRANSPQPLELTDSRANSPQPLELAD